jgi:hypothetical protein
MPVLNHVNLNHVSLRLTPPTADPRHTCGLAFFL